MKNTEIDYPNTFQEEDCTHTHQGRAYECTGAVIDGDRLVAYLKDDGILTDWHGNEIGTYKITSTWKLLSYVSTTMSQVYACVDGCIYTGRSAGVGMILQAKRCRQYPRRLNGFSYRRSASPDMFNYYSAS